MGVPEGLPNFLSVLAPIQIAKKSDGNLTIFLRKIAIWFVIWKQTRRALLGITEIFMLQAQRSRILEGGMCQERGGRLDLSGISLIQVFSRGFWINSSKICISYFILGMMENTSGS